MYSNGADPAQAAAWRRRTSRSSSAITMGETTDSPTSTSTPTATSISAVAATSDRTVAVINAGSAVEMPWLDDVDAVLHRACSGEQFGPALAALLTG